MNNQDSLNEFKRKVWITRKSRIEASERIMKKYNLYQALLVYYSIVIVIFSIWNIQPTNTNGHITEASLFLMIVSIIFSLFSLFVSTKNLQEKYFNLKINYLEIEKIHGRLQGIESTNAVQDITHIQNQYINLLSSVDNHETIDYYKVLLNDSKEKEEAGEVRVKEMKNYVNKSEQKEQYYKYLLYLAPLFLPVIIKALMYVINILYPTS